MTTSNSTPTEGKLLSDTNCANILASLVSQRREDIDAKVAILLAEFDRAVKDGAIQPDPEREAVVLAWTPARKSWVEVAQTLIAALTKKTGMEVRWNGCRNGCPIRFRPRVEPVTLPPIITKEAMFNGVKGLCGMMHALKTDREVSDTSIDSFVDFVYSNYIDRHQISPSGTSQFCLGGICQDQEDVCHHVSPTSYHIPQMMSRFGHGQM